MSTTPEPPSPLTLPNSAEFTKARERFEPPGLALALSRNSATFNQLTDAHYLSQSRFNTDVSSQRVYAGFRDPLFAAFEAAHKGIAEITFSSHAWAAAALTGDERLHVVHRGVGGDISMIDGEVHSLEALVPDLDDPRDRDVCLRGLYSACTYVCGYLNEGASNPAVLEGARERLSMTRAFFERVATRNARLKYYAGMLRGLLIILPVSVIAGFALEFLGPDLSAELLVTSLVGGGLGGAVSVMVRLSSDSWHVDYLAGSKQLRNLGAFRPLVGATFGLAVTAAIAGGLIPIERPDSPGEAFYLYGALAFVAGFSERWAQDIVVTSVPGAINS